MDQLVAGHTILRQSPLGATEFRWSAWDNFSVQDWVALPSNLAQLTSVDFDHPNSLEIDRDGNYIVSFANLTEITKIDAVTGRILWRFGGRHNQFTISGEPLGGFGIQHDVRLLDNGDLLLYDNGTFHNPPQSRAVQYRLDTRLMTASLVWEYRHTPAVFTPFVGSVQRFRNGHTLVGFGAAGLMTEVTPDDRVVWEGRLTIPGRRSPCSTGCGTCRPCTAPSGLSTTGNDLRRPPSPLQQSWRCSFPRAEYARQTFPETWPRVQQ